MGSKVIADITRGFARLELVLLDAISEQGKVITLTKLRNRWRFSFSTLREVGI